MSVFHAFVEGNGTKPLRLALSPVLILLHADATTAGFTVMSRSEVADCAGWPESITLKMTEVVPTSLCCGVPVMAPEEPLMARSLCRLVAL